MRTAAAVETERTHIPNVSVGLPVFNGEKFLRQAVESILRQDSEDFELIISDNASADGTRRICEEYARRDRRVRYHRHEVNVGAAANHNHVVALARGRYFKWAAHDDECRPEFLSRCVEVLDQTASVVLAYPQAELIDQDGQRIGQYTVSIACRDTRPHVRLDHLIRNIRLGTPMYGVIRTDVLRKTRLHGTFMAADLLLLGELALLGEIREVPLQLLRKRFHPGRSQEANRTLAEHLLWFDPRSAPASQRLPPGYRLTQEYLRSIWHLPLRLLEKVTCCFVVIRRRHRGRRLMRMLRTLSGLPTPPPAARPPLIHKEDAGQGASPLSS